MERFKNLSIRTMNKMFDVDNANEVYDGIWIGNHYSSQDIIFLQENDIKAVINCTRTVPFTREIRNNYRVSVNDAFDNVTRMAVLIDDAANWLDLQRRQGNNVLVHCNAGIQRSSTVVAYYLMKFKGIGLDEAIIQIKKNRPIALRNPMTFYKILESFDRYITGARARGKCIVK